MNWSEYWLSLVAQKAGIWGYVVSRLGIDKATSFNSMRDSNPQALVGYMKLIK